MEPSSDNDGNPQQCGKTDVVFKSLLRRMPGYHAVAHLYHGVVRKCGAGVTGTDFNIFNLGYVNKRKQNRLATSWKASF